MQLARVLPTSLAWRDPEWRGFFCGRSVQEIQPTPEPPRSLRGFVARRSPQARPRALPYTSRRQLGRSSSPALPHTGVIGTLKRNVAPARSVKVEPLSAPDIDPQQCSVPQGRQTGSLVLFTRTLPEDHMEHRWGHRTLIDQPVRIAAAAHNSCTARLRNISASGAFLSTHQTAAFRGRVQVQFPLPSNGGSEYTVEALVARKAPDGIGVEWIAFSPACISQIIQAYSRDGRPKPQPVNGSMPPDQLAAALPNTLCPSSHNYWNRQTCSSARRVAAGNENTLLECSRRQHRPDRGSFDLATLLRHPGKALKLLLRSLSCYFDATQGFVARRPNERGSCRALRRTAARQPASDIRMRGGNN
jgi:hypothetical protein